jgi:hypothetical protein
MLYAESVWIKSKIQYLAELNIQGVVLNIGSSTSTFIDTYQPYIRMNVLNQLQKIGPLLNIDLKNHDGVDIVANFLEEKDRILLQKQNAKVILVSNLLEHIPDPLLGIKRLSDLITVDSFLILTGPRSYPYHPDPIDNMFRPSQRLITQLFKNDWEIVELITVKNGTVLSANYPRKEWRQPYQWALKQLTLSNLLRNPKGLLKIIRNAVTPASAFCVLLKRI